MEYEKSNWDTFYNRYSHEIEEKINEESKRQKYPVGIVTLETGERILTIEKDKRTWYLNSRINPVRAAEIYSERYDKRIYNTYFIFGMGDGLHVRELLKKCDETNQMVIIEPDIMVFKKAMSYFPLKDIIEDSRVILMLPDITGRVYSIVDQVISYSRINLVEFCILPGYDILYNEECQTAMDDIVNGLQNIRVNIFTQMTFQRKIPQNGIFHMKEMITKSNCVEIKAALEKKNIEQIPAIIVSAGPSLDKNIDELKNAQGKSLIICVDAAVKSVIQAGIRPDIVVSVDPNVPDRFFENIDLSNLNWILSYHSKPEILKNFKGKVFYYDCMTTGWKKSVEKELGYHIPTLGSGGSVSTIAYSLAIYFGFKKIILVGQDLAFTGGKTHTKGVEEVFGDNEEYKKSRMIVEVEGIDGMMLETDVQMMRYRKWFEERIEEWKESIKVINATEGGALIKGAENKVLRDVIKEECRVEANFYDTICQIPPSFSEEKQLILYKKLKTMRQEMEDLKNILLDSISTLKDLQEQIKKKQVNDKKKKEILLKVSELNDVIGKNDMSEWLTMYASGEEHQMSQHIFQEEEIDERELIDQTLHLYEDYYSRTELFLEDYDAFAV